MKPVMLAHEYDLNGPFSVAGWFASVKYDGMRAIWDGGRTRGKKCSSISWANTVKDVKETIATGLWTRQKKPIYAPKWFLDTLPEGLSLDGELWAGRGKFQKTMSIVRKHVPIDNEWKRIRYMVFDIPEVKAEYFYVYDMLCRKVQNKFSFQEKSQQPKQFAKIQVVDQTVLWNLKQLKELLAEEIALGGEGLMLRNPECSYEHKRSHNLLKCKPWYTDSGTVLGYVWGKETNKGSKLMGLMGTVIIQYGKKRLEISGFTDKERAIARVGSKTQITPSESISNAGERISAQFWNPLFPVGSKIVFRFREKSTSGIPLKAVYLRRT